VNIRRIIQALGNIDVQVRDRDLLAALDSEALHIGAFLAGALLVPFLGRAGRRTAKFVTSATRLAVDCNRAASPGSAAKSEGSNALPCDLIRDRVAVVVRDHTLKVHVFALLVIFGPHGEAPCVGADKGHGGEGEDRRNLHFESGKGSRTRVLKGVEWMGKKRGSMHEDK
jgi:hypothetical protein